ncbi:MAG: hypothetical protein KatS3mg025_0361 [Bacteroidia bacterium]|jgi:hypothetical protein|nr:MAG: hypothetical protein KatS3mg025_0361 [Bacteroidia bacterium]
MAPFLLALFPLPDLALADPAEAMREKTKSVRVSDKIHA